jgi:hypothetical protein
MTVSECTVSDSEGNIKDVQDVRTIVGTIITAKNDPFKFYVQMEKTDGGITKISSQQVQIVMPLGGMQAGLFRIPRVGEKVLVGFEDSGSNYLIGYIPTTTSSSQNFFQTKGMSQDDGRGEVFRYQQTGKKTALAGEEYSEIGFCHEKTAWKAADAASYADIPSAPNDYPLIDRINIHSTGDIHESAVNHHQIQAKRFELLVNCDNINHKTNRVIDEETGMDKEELPLGDFPGDDSVLHAGDFHVRTGSRIVMKAEESIILQVGRTTLEISDDGFSVITKNVSGNLPNTFDTTFNMSPRGGISMGGKSIKLAAGIEFAVKDRWGGSVKSAMGNLSISGRNLGMKSVNASDFAFMVAVQAIETATNIATASVAIANKENLELGNTMEKIGEKLTALVNMVKDIYDDWPAAVESVKMVKKPFDWVKGKLDKGSDPNDPPLTP